jgi:MarR family transcriptional regulator, 2-MHQ and catechol-resistance regulon repressor
MATKYKGSPSEKLALDVFIKLARANEAVTEATFGPILAAGLTPTQFGVIETLYHLGKLMPSQLADKHLKSRNNLTVVIDKLERQDLVRRERCSKDRRALWVVLTEKGRQVVEQVLPRHVAMISQRMGMLSPEELETLNELLRKLGRISRYH